MIAPRIATLMGLLALAGGARADTEINLWPGPVSRLDASGNEVSRETLGPLFFSKPLADGGVSSGFRPFVVQHTSAAGQLVTRQVLYPLYFYRGYGDASTWSLFELVNKTSRAPGAVEPMDEDFAVWPFYFTRKSASGEGDYQAVFPIRGTLVNFMGYDRLAWTLFPLYVESERHGAMTTYAPWPFYRRYSGTQSGFGLWPLYGATQGPGASTHTFALWPVYWDNTVAPKDDAPAGTPPQRQFGIFPLYTRDSGPGSISENYLWPFFGYSDRTVPDRYHETRYLWPIFVQGEGDGRLLNRWGPFYTHSWSAKGSDRVWIGWPLWNEETWQSDGVSQDYQRLFYFVYWSLKQRSLANPSAAPAVKTHVWPIVSRWDNGRGHVQVQVPSPLEVFFPHNDMVRETWTPLFAAFRYEATSAAESRTSLLWNALTWYRNDVERTREFHLGPLFSSSTRGESVRYRFAQGLFTLSRDGASAPWKALWLDFSAKPAKTSPSSEPTVK